MTTDPEIRRMVDDSVLTTALIGDICDCFGRYHQFLPAEIRALRPDLSLVGRAMPVIAVDVFGPQKQPFGLLTEALDQLEPGEVYVGGGGLMRNASWGELLTVTAKARGAAGALINGWHRDTRAVIAEGWPVFSRGGFGQDAGSRSSVVAYRVPVEIGEVTVEPGALLVGDADGVVVVPRDIEQEVLGQAMEKSSKERRVREAIIGGMSSSSAWTRFGVL